MTPKTISLILLFALLGYFLTSYLSDSHVSERQFNAMLESGKLDLPTIENYLKHHNQNTDMDYDKALLLAAKLDNKYLEMVIDYYTSGRLIIDTSTAKLITERLPSDSISINYAAGRIYATNEFNQYRPRKAVEVLEYAALRGDRNAAAILASIYSKSDCYVEAITWAREANKRSVISECTQLPVNINLLSDQQMRDVAFNEQELETAESENRLPVLHYSEHCEPGK